MTGIESIYRLTPFEKEFLEDTQRLLYNRDDPKNMQKKIDGFRIG